MGKGSFDGKHFKLFASFDFNATASEIKKWKCALQAASHALFHATDAQMSIGTIIASNHGLGKDKADIVITDSPGQSGTTGPLVPEKPFCQVELCSDEVMHPGVVVHELGHYLLALKDEYIEYVKPVTLDGHCGDGPPGESSCIMEFSGLGDTISSHKTCSVNHGTVRQFCCAANHTAHNNQQVFNKQSCWETIIGRWGIDGLWGKFPSIVGPAAGTRPSGAPAGSRPEDMEWMDVSARSKVVCLVSDEQSPGTMYADFVRLFIAPLSLIEKSLQLRCLVPAPQMNQFSLELKKALNELQKALDFQVVSLTVANLYRELDGPPAANQRIVMQGSPSPELRNYLLQNADRYVTDVSNAGFFSHGIADTSQFQEIMFNTNGQNRLLLPGTTSASRVRNASQYLATAFECLETWGMLDDQVAAFPGPVHSTSADTKRFSTADIKRVKSRPVTVEISPTQCDFPVYVEAEAKRVAFCSKPQQRMLKFGCTSDDPTARSSIHNRLPLFFPSNKIISFMSISVAKLKSLEGQWTMRLERSSAENLTPFHLRAYTSNSDLGMHLQVTRQPEPNAFQTGGGRRIRQPASGRSRSTVRQSFRDFTQRRGVSIACCRTCTINSKC